MKRDFYREIWRQKGVLIRELAVKAKFITPRKFLHTPEMTPSTSTTSLAETARGKRRWPQIFRHRSSIPPPPSPMAQKVTRFTDEDEPLVSSPSSESFPPSGTSTPQDEKDLPRRGSASSGPGRRSTSSGLDRAVAALRSV